MSSETLEVIRSLAPYAGILVTLFGFIFVIRQLRLNRLSVKTQTRSNIYQLSHGVYKLFVDNPELRPYFYEGKALPDTETERSKVLAAAELLTDFFEHIVYSGEVLEPAIRDTWFEYMRRTYSQNPAYSTFIQDRRSDYTEALHQAMGSAHPPH